MCNRKSLAGFTLVELLVTIVIASILTALAIPSFQSTISNSRLTASANELIGAFSYAKSEAVKRGVAVTVLRKGGTANDWGAGWDVFVDADNDSVLAGNAKSCLDGQDCLLRTYDAVSAGYTLVTNGGGYATSAVFLPSGLSSTNSGSTFTLCDSSGDDSLSRQIIINAIGRARVSVGTGTCP